MNQWPICKSCGAPAETERFAVVMPMPNAPEKSPLCEACWAARRQREIAWRTNRDANLGSQPINKDRLKQAKTKASTPRLHRHAAS